MMTLLVQLFIHSTDKAGSIEVIFLCSRFARAGGATNSNHMKNQSHGRCGHAKKVDVVLISWRVCEQSGQKIHRLDNYRENWVMFAPPIRAKRLQWKIAFTSALPSQAKRTKWYVKCAYKNQSPLILNAFGKTNLYSQIRCSVAGNIDQLIALTNCNRCEQIAFFVLTIRQKVTPKCQMPNIWLAFFVLVANQALLFWR
jgi:hypothetical protein